MALLPLIFRIAKEELNKLNEQNLLPAAYSKALDKEMFKDNSKELQIAETSSIFVPTDFK